MNQKAKGLNAERELIHMLWKNGFAAVRVAGSGSSKYPSPDILAGNGHRHLAIECKITKSKNKYFTRREISDLRRFCSGFGTEGYVAVKFPKKAWYFFLLDDLHVTGPNSCSVSVDDIDVKGLTFKQLIDVE